MEVTIPKTFQLLGIEYRVKQDNKIMFEGESVLGLHDPKTATVHLRKNLRKDLKEQTFLHEVTHAVLESLGHAKLSHNEQFVDSFSNALYQVLKTSK